MDDGHPPKQKSKSQRDFGKLLEPHVGLYTYKLSGEWNAISWIAA